uniref:DUF8041 domain-containing protein n=1 Tax=Oryza glumipatula TaxID=40148 RepID=A0A0D9YMT9_9ORYZ
MVGGCNTVGGERHGRVHGEVEVHGGVLEGVRPDSEREQWEVDELVDDGKHGEGEEELYDSDSPAATGVSPAPTAATTTVIVSHAKGSNSSAAYKCVKRNDTIWGAWFFFTHYFKPVMLADKNGKAKAPTVVGTCSTTWRTCICGCSRSGQRMPWGRCTCGEDAAAAAPPHLAPAGLLRHPDRREEGSLPGRRRSSSIFLVRDEEEPAGWDDPKASAPEDEEEEPAFMVSSLREWCLMAAQREL